jgi:hypothetical protein
MPTLQHRHLLLSGRPLKPDLFEFRADRAVFEDAGTDAAEDTDPVYQWNDQGPGSYHATQATLANRPTLSSAAIPNYVSWDGADDRMLFGGSAVLANTNAPFSIEAWVNLTSFGFTIFPGVLGLKTNTTDLWQVGISNNGSYLGLHFGSSTTWSRFKTDTAAASWLGADRHVVVTYNGGGAGTAANFAAYIDGVPQVLTTPGAFSPATNTSSVIGASTISATEKWYGRAYKYAGFSRALTPAQVLARYALGVSG